MLKVHAAVEVQLAVCTGSIITSPSYLKLSNLTLLSDMVLLSEINDTNWIKVGCKVGCAFRDLWFYFRDL